MWTLEPQPFPEVQGPSVCEVWVRLSSEWVGVAEGACKGCWRRHMSIVHITAVPGSTRHQFWVHFPHVSPFLTLRAARRIASIKGGKLEEGTNYAACSMMPRDWHSVYNRK